MYSLDINLIKDRPEDKLEKGTKRPKLRLGAGNMSLLYLGAAAGILLPALVGAGLLHVQNQNAKLEQQIAQLDAELGSLALKEQEIQKILEETNQIKTQTQALATVFNQIRPWSATLQDIGDRIPSTVRIESVKQIAPATAQEGQPAPNPAGGIEISGIARSFNDVNDFLLILQQSPFFKSTDTRIVTAESIDSPIPAEGNVPQSAMAVVIKPPPIVRYTIQSSLSDVPASELIRELERKGTLGLVTRIRTLQERGVIQQ